jgi:tetratricopeptide (TPR) repeat protein
MRVEAFEFKFDDGSISGYRELVNRDPHNVFARLNLGSALLFSGQRDAANAEFREILRADPPHPNVKALAHVYLGDSLFEEDDPEGAIAEFTQAIALVPQGFGVLIQLGKALSRTGRLDEARRCWQAVLAHYDSVSSGSTAEELHNVGFIEEARRLLQSFPFE